MKANATWDLQGDLASCSWLWALVKMKPAKIKEFRTELRWLVVKRKCEVKWQKWPDTVKIRSSRDDPQCRSSRRAVYSRWRLPKRLNMLRMRRFESIAKTRGIFKSFRDNETFDADDLHRQLIPFQQTSVANSINIRATFNGSALIAINHDTFIFISKIIKSAKICQIR